VTVMRKKSSERPLSRQTRSWRQTSKVRDTGIGIIFSDGFSLDVLQGADAKLLVRKKGENLNVFVFLAGWVEALKNNGDFFG
jgi:hypothetical protein